MNERRRLCSRCRQERAAWSVTMREGTVLETFDCCDRCRPVSLDVVSIVRIWLDVDGPPENCRA